MLDVAGEAKSLHFGMLLSGAGAVDLARPDVRRGQSGPLTPRQSGAYSVTRSSQLISAPMTSGRLVSLRISCRAPA